MTKVSDARIFATRQGAPCLFVLTCRRKGMGRGRLLCRMTHCGFSSFVIGGFSLSFSRSQNVKQLIVHSFTGCRRTRCCRHRLCTSPRVGRHLDKVQTILVSRAGCRLLGRFCDFSSCSIFCGGAFSPCPARRRMPVSKDALSRPLLGLPPISRAAPTRRSRNRRVRRSPNAGCF